MVGHETGDSLDSDPLDDRNRIADFHVFIVSNSVADS